MNSIRSYFNLVIIFAILIILGEKSLPALEKLRAAGEGVAIPIGKFTGVADDGVAVAGGLQDVSGSLLKMAENNFTDNAFSGFAGITAKGDKALNVEKGVSLAESVLHTTNDVAQKNLNLIFETTKEISNVPGFHSLAEQMAKNTDNFGAYFQEIATAQLQRNGAKLEAIEYATKKFPVDVAMLSDGTKIAAEIKYAHTGSVIFKQEMATQLKNYAELVKSNQFAKVHLVSNGKFVGVREFLEKEGISAYFEIVENFATPPIIK